MRRRGSLAAGARRAVAAWAAAGALVLACDRGPGRIHVRSVALADGAVTPSLREAGVDEAAVRNAASSALEAAGFRLGDGGRPHRSLVAVPSVRLLPPIATGNGPRVEVTVEIALAAAEPGAGAPQRETGTAAVPLASARLPRDAWVAALSQAARAAAEGLALALAAEEKSPSAVVADLTSEDPRVREHAIRASGERRIRAAVPVLVARLKVEEPRLVHRVVAALAQIGDERAVAPLIDLAHGVDAALTTRVVRFIGDIGGAEAEGYLLTIASGHPDSRVRTAARKALDEMSARAKEAAVAARK